MVLGRLGTIMSHSSNDSWFHDRVWGLYIAALFGVLFVVFAVGLLFGSRDPDTSIGALIVAAGFTVWLACMMIGGIGMAAKLPWADGFTGGLLSLAALAIQVAFVWDVTTAIVAHDPRPAASYYAVAVWIAVGAVMYLPGRERTPRPACFECAIWPVLLFLKAPAASILLFAIPTASVVTGEWIGAKFHHPHVGVGVGFTLFLALAAFATYRSNALTGTTKQDGPDH